MIKMRGTIYNALLSSHYIAIKGSHISEVIDYVVHCCGPVFSATPLLSLHYQQNLKNIFRIQGWQPTPLGLPVVFATSRCSVPEDAPPRAPSDVVSAHSHLGCSRLLSQQVVLGPLIHFWFLFLAGLSQHSNSAVTTTQKRLCFFCLFIFKNYYLFKYLSVIWNEKSRHNLKIPKASCPVIVHRFL